MARRLRGALLGAGNIALRGHAPQWLGDKPLAEQVEIVAVADLGPANLEAARALLPETRRYARAEDLLAEERLDFCDICTPPFTHRGLIDQAAARGLHLVCEKPLAPSLADAQRIAAAVRGARVVFQPCHQYHHSTQWLAVKRLLPRIGHVHLADYQVHRLAANEGNPNWAPRWRIDRDLAGGGILVDHGAHIFYQLRSVLGDPRSVRATIRTLSHHGYGVEDTAFVTLDFGDRLAQVSLTWAARRREIRFHFVGEDGELIGDEERVRVHAATTEEIVFEGGMSKNSSHSEWYAPLLRGFCRRVRSGDVSTGPLDEAIFVTRLIERAYESSRLGTALPLLPARRERPAAPTPLAPDAAKIPALVAEMPIAASFAAGGLTAATAPAGVAEALAPASAAGAAAVSPAPAAIATGEIPPAELAAEAALAADGNAAGRRGAPALRWLALAALALAVAWTFRDLRWSALRNVLRVANPGLLALAAAVNLAVLAFQAARWHAVIRPVTRLATLGRSFKAMMVGFTVSMVVPARAGELARAHYMGLFTGLSRTSILGSIVLDHLVNAAGLLAALAFLPYFIGVPIWVQSGGWVALALFVVAAMIVAALRLTGKRAVPGTEHVPVRRFSSLVAKIQQGLTGVGNPRALGVSLGASLAAWALEVNVASISLRAVGLHMALPAVILVLLAVNLALVFPVAPPGNLGTLELGATLALLEFGVPKEQALAFALCYHLLQIVPIAILGVFFASRVGFSRAFSRDAP